ncbi:jg4909 [Pararge aegeria aegeria]|uniref:Jg4909 protein n=1 Tax=Pararge aegeria aegeria TaxID=348720 RepID=A0A8S4SKX0_9NEOP|nr:jg4909 [Pararge aegeria aegeria]
MADKQSNTSQRMQVKLHQPKAKMLMKSHVPVITPATTPFRPEHINAGRNKLVLMEAGTFYLKSQRLPLRQRSDHSSSESAIMDPKNNPRIMSPGLRGPHNFENSAVFRHSFNSVNVGITEWNECLDLGSPKYYPT